jgi:N-methylhydantoinase A/oxoprolinase/acetone carboxylase beta subunit
MSRKTLIEVMAGLRELRAGAQARIDKIEEIVHSTTLATNAVADAYMRPLVDGYGSRSESSFTPGRI